MRDERRVQNVNKTINLTVVCITESGIWCRRRRIYFNVRCRIKEHPAINQVLRFD